MLTPTNSRWLLFLTLTCRDMCGSNTTFLPWTSCKWKELWATDGGSRGPHEKREAVEEAETVFPHIRLLSLQLSHVESHSRSATAASTPTSTRSGARLPTTVTMATTWIQVFRWAACARRTAPGTTLPQPPDVYVSVLTSMEPTLWMMNGKHFGNTTGGP